ncbi:hypothetical protein C8J55DRAFT_561497 [Lentinula edodes]|uniref:Uncharacterized protein n=1 Tax=Lentinula lateritia TaxID=40482 RepID=A0A9W9A891_9AGAR|nr:hypothetical protein C8J55DRAFT_561497 [Lentinula edodes]
MTFPEKLYTFMNSTDVLLLLDNSQISSSFLDSNVSWVKSTDTTGRWVRNSSTYIGSPGGQVVVTFQGTVILFTGSTPSSSTNPPAGYLASIVRGRGELHIPNAGVTQYYTQWYESPILDDRAAHRLICADVDYAIVTVGQTTRLGRTSTIIVDDSNTEVKYQGSGWNTSDASLMMNGSWAHGPPLGNSTHRINSLGNAFGSNFLAVTIAFLNGLGPEALLSISLWTSKPLLRNHTLIVNVTDAIGNQEFVFDYLTYIPSFESLTNKPDFTNTGSALP